MKKILFAALFACILFSCKQNKPETVERAFYYWKSNRSYISDMERKVLDSAQVTKVYVKFFEVEKNDVMGNIPISKTSLRFYDVKDYFTFVPTVYLHNDVFSKIDKASLDTLANNVNYLIDKYVNDKLVPDAVTEYQMDCDWTPSTKENYFYFLKKIKELSGKKISCTLRLYPYKYADKMGVPPVDSAMLMCYNLINPMKNHDKNSILDIDELSSYLGDFNYPLHLDVALPLYSWAHVYQNNQFVQVLYTDIKELKKSLKPQKDLWYEVTEDIEVNDFYLRKGDKVKIEEMSADYINKAIAVITKKVPFDKNITVSFFHLDETQLSPYTHEEISAFYTGFTK
ncbi:hypothetical protein FUA48_11425 [Flavobacterium alkalisoli]|uniref:Lipoprotein n=1 Tax=Flavobacterium alkalisoli TaxID=2602769 RepID=A0A5B9FT60_9FLAO|nr:hypothetical protein [Flavobacterium alkalisoli]QEE50165.1 hypothetical protein FUA48_11425 [Flavobacterium alkalisoli]